MDFSKINSYTKENLLYYFRARTKEYYSEIEKKYSNTEYKRRAATMNNTVTKIRDNVLKALFNLAKKKGIEDKSIIASVLTAFYASYVVMLEGRNYYWPYEYMSFSRRIGELWEPFCKIPFDYPTKDLEIFIPPTFEDVTNLLSSEIREYILSLPISSIQRDELMLYYDKVWQLVSSGDIKLELDLHFIQNDLKYVVDYKSGFHSNEKGNTNRLLLVGAIYKNLSLKYRPLIFVRSDKEDSSNYLQTLDKSKIWSVYCGEEAYSQIFYYTGFDLKSWIDLNIDWKKDISKELFDHLDSNDLIKYLSW